MMVRSDTFSFRVYSLAEGQLLHWAVRNGHIRISQVLLKFVSDVDAPNFRGETPLHLAAKNGYTDLAELLMKLGSNVNSKDYQQQTPLHLAAWSGCLEIANDLMRHGSDVNARDDSQQTPLHLAAWSGCQEIVNALIRHGSDVKARDDFQQTPLHLAAWSGCQEIANALIRHGSDVKARDDSQQTTPHLAVLNGHRNIAEVLTKNGSGVNARDIFGETPLHLAARSGDQEITEFLIQQESELEANNNSKQSALHLAAQNGHTNRSDARDIFGQTSLHLTSSHLSVPNGDKNVTVVLCEVSYGVMAMFGDTPLHLDAWSGHQELTEFLLRHGSGGQALDDHLPNNNVNVCNGQQSPLHLAAENDYKHICDVLTHNGSDVNTKDKKTPLHLVAINPHESLAAILGNQHRRLLLQFFNQTPYKSDSFDAPVVLLENNETNFPQTSCEPFHQETQSCLATIDLSIGLGNQHRRLQLQSFNQTPYKSDSIDAPVVLRDHKLIVDKPLMIQCLNISLGGGDKITGDIYPVPVIKYQGSRSRYTSLIDHPACLLHSPKFATNGRRKDRDVNEAKYSHRVLIRSGLSLENYAYVLVNVVMVFLTLVAFKVRTSRVYM